MVQLTPEEFDEVARKKTPLIGPGSERRVPSGRGGTVSAELGPLDREILGTSVRIDFELGTLTQLRADIDLVIERLQMARSVLTQVDVRDRTLMFEARSIIRSAALKISPTVRRRKKITYET